ncbi:succinate dehydrogenase flavoprotein subunit [Histoplasma capsulatum G186AR]|uniref:Succinate dehydrogenase flavoprotein subunit n=1 Tax=Ajellomyces capsulatus TaxID=5037 RepID=A0A8H8D6U6_AJECA|nr:succinate dehydrogenase flavoprotein subunit [Histoplasma capsulatum]QSS69394.1 succinate dehydrogenase flavoprotein subunit [Histoplasma capsulatum G186AR]
MQPANAPISLLHGNSHQSSCTADAMTTWQLQEDLEICTLRQVPMRNALHMYCTCTCTSIPYKGHRYRHKKKECDQKLRCHSIAFMQIRSTKLRQHDTIMLHSTPFRAGLVCRSDGMIYPIAYWMQCIIPHNTTN